MLVAFSAFATGCGAGPNVRAIALKSVPAGSHPRIVRIVDMPPDMDNLRIALVLLRFKKPLHALCVQAKPPIHLSRSLRVCHPHFRVIPIALNVGNNIASPGDVLGKFVVSGSQVLAIDRARRARPDLTRFPDFEGWGNNQCTIPNPLGEPPGTTVHGNCWTDAQPPAQVRYVDFAEDWRANDSWHEDHWLVTFNSDGRVQSVRHLPTTVDEIRRLLR